MRPSSLNHRSLRLAFFAVTLARALLGSCAGAADAGWVANVEVQRRLADGEVVVQVATASDADGPRGSVRAAVLIRARPEAIWSVMIDCREALRFVPGLRLCRRLDAAPDGRWAVIEQEISYSWFLPAVHNVLRADCDRPRRIDFHRIRGDLRQEEGTWVLAPTADGSATVVEYEMYLDPGFWVPQWLINRSLRISLPAALAGLRERVERPSEGRPH
ncbi:MAG TPA: SRPBCC family protein [Steroidobacteraceae bacterium]|nr:SRPBCC family protein [Steroidobacteraceae bacterium]